MTAITVVMPVLNEERSVAGAVQSVLGQTLDDVELLVVDGDSTDGTGDAVRRIAARDPRVRLLRNPQRAIPHALNIALSHARGEHLARVDGHASVNRSYLERAARTLAADPEVAAVGGRRIGVARTAAGVAVATALSSRFGVGDSINHYARHACDTDHASFGVFRVRVLREVGGWDEDLLVNEDVDLDHRILSRGHRIRFDPDMHIYWHVRESCGSLARQYRRYGRGKAAMVRKNGRGAVRLRHLAPPALVLALLAAVILAVTGFWVAALVLSVPYLLAIAAAVVITLRTTAGVAEPPEPLGRSVSPGPPAADGAQPSARSDDDWTGEGPRRRPNPLRLAASFVSMHLGWGLGFLEGLLLRLRPATASAPVPPRRRDPQVIALDDSETSKQQVSGRPEA